MNKETLPINHSSEDETQKDEVVNNGPANQENVNNEEPKSNNSLGLKVGLGVAAVAATGAVAAKSLAHDSHSTVAENPAVQDTTPVVDETLDAQTETFSNDAPPADLPPTNPSHEPQVVDPVINETPSDVYVHTIDEFGNESTTHYSDLDGDGELDQYEVIDTEGNVIESGDVDNVSVTDSPENDPYVMDPYGDEPLTQNDPDIIDDHANQPEEGDYDGIDWDAVENGEMDEVAVNEGSGTDNDDVLAENDGDYNDDVFGFNESELVDDSDDFGGSESHDEMGINALDNDNYVAEEDNSSDYILDDDGQDFGSDDYAMNEDGSEDYAMNEDGSEDYAMNEDGSDGYGSDDYGSDDYGSDDYGSDDYGSDDYGSDDYGSGDYGSDDIGC